MGKEFNALLMLELNGELSESVMKSLGRANRQLLTVN